MEEIKPILTSAVRSATFSLKELYHLYYYTIILMMLVSKLTIEFCKQYLPFQKQKHVETRIHIKVA